VKDRYIQCDAQSFFDSHLVSPVPLLTPVVQQLLEEQRVIMVEVGEHVSYVVSSGAVLFILDRMLGQLVDGELP
jgi:hypothetical protein